MTDEQKDAVEAKAKIANRWNRIMVLDAASMGLMQSLLQPDDDPDNEKIAIFLAAVWHKRGSDILEIAKEDASEVYQAATDFAENLINAVNLKEELDGIEL